MWYCICDLSYFSKFMRKLEIGKLKHIGVYALNEPYPYHASIVRWKLKWSTWFKLVGTKKNKYPTPRQKILLFTKFSSPLWSERADTKILTKAWSIMSSIYIYMFHISPRNSVSVKCQKSPRHKRKDNAAI